MAKLRAHAKLLENTRIILDNNRGHSVICDLPENEGGKNAGPTPFELALMALAGCSTMIYAIVCKNSKIAPCQIEIAVEAEETPNSPFISNVAMKVNINSLARKGLVEAVWRRTEANCPVLFIYKEQVPVKINVEIKAH